MPPRCSAKNRSGDLVGLDLSGPPPGTLPKRPGVTVSLPKGRERPTQPGFGGKTSPPGSLRYPAAGMQIGLFRFHARAGPIEGVEAESGVDEGSGMNGQDDNQVNEPAARPDAPEQPDISRPARRDIVRHGIKLVFVAPVISTFFVREAQAVPSAASCKPAGSPCPLPGLDPECCSGNCTGFNVCD